MFPSKSNTHIPTPPSGPHSATGLSASCATAQERAIPSGPTYRQQHDKTMTTSHRQIPTTRTTQSTKRRKSPSQGGKKHKNDTRKHRNLRSWTTHSLSRPRGTHIRFTTHTINPFSLFSSPFFLSPLFVTCSTACSRQQHFTALDEIMMTEPTYRRTLLVINTPQSLGHVKWGNRRPRLGLLTRRLVEGFHLSLLIHVIFRPFLCNCPLNVLAPGCWRKGGREEGEDGSMRSGRPCSRDTYFAIFFF